VAQPGELVALQRITGRREKELPRRLSFVDQGSLQAKHYHVTGVDNPVNSTQRYVYCGKLCKSIYWTRGRRAAAHAEVETL
jgi:hypothetical protein